MSRLDESGRGLGEAARGDMSRARVRLECCLNPRLRIDRSRARQSEEEIEENLADEFRDAFPQPCKPSETARNVEIYLNKVEDIVQKLEEWFPPSSAE